jgi:hypothetical protein
LYSSHERLAKYCIFPILVEMAHFSVLASTACSLV